MVRQLQEEEKALGLDPPWTDRKASTGKPFPSPTHPTASPGNKQAESATHRPLETRLRSFLCFQGFILQPSAVWCCWESGTDPKPCPGEHGTHSHCVQGPASSQQYTAAPRSQKTSVQPPARTQIKTSPSWNPAITQAPRLEAMFISLLNVAMTTTSSFEMSRRRSWATCQAQIKYHTSRQHRRVSSAGCHLQFKKTNTLTWQAHPLQNSLASRHNHSKASKELPKSKPLEALSATEGSMTYLSTLHHTRNSPDSSTSFLPWNKFTKLSGSEILQNPWPKKTTKPNKQLPFQACILLFGDPKPPPLNRTVPGSI